MTFGAPGVYAFKTTPLSSSAITPTIQDPVVSTTESYPIFIYSSVPALVQPHGSVLYDSAGYVQDVASVTFTPTGTVSTSRLASSSPQKVVVWDATSQAQPLSSDRLIITKNTTIEVPPNATQVHIQAWGGGGAGGAVFSQSNTIGVPVSVQSGSGGGSGGAFVYDGPISSASSRTITFTIGKGGSKPGENGGDTIVDIGGLKIPATGGKAGATSQPAPPVPGGGASTSGGAMAGGAGGTAGGNLYLPPPINFSIIPGAQGGATSQYIDGQYQPPQSGNLCGSTGMVAATPLSTAGLAGCIAGGTLVYSSPGGGAGGYVGSGGSADNFTYDVQANNLEIVGGGSAATLNGGGGGAGEGPGLTSAQPGVPGADGGAILIFS